MLSEPIVYNNLPQKDKTYIESLGYKRKEQPNKEVSRKVENNESDQQKIYQVTLTTPHADTPEKRPLNHEQSQISFIDDKIEKENSIQFEKSLHIKTESQAVETKIPKTSGAFEYRNGWESIFDTTHNEEISEQESRKPIVVQNSGLYNKNSLYKINEKNEYNFGRTQKVKNYPYPIFMYLYSYSFMTL